ncbi:MAG TPA: NifU family protein [Planctomycetota bacterium]|jgi:Fe-S cluster biogenesis protein NfuA|nr:NifU family protein [Planctomycetota bacterium]
MTDHTLRIKARPQVIPTRCDFEVERQVLDGTAWFGSAESAKGSPLPEKLFAVPGVAQVLIRGDSLTVTRTEDVEWPNLARQIGAIIREHLLSGEPVVSESAMNSGSDDQMMRDQIEVILEREINPAIASHGGVITLLDVQQGVVYVKMGGGCQGCASSTATLKQGVEQTIRARVPGVVQILDTTDHAAGMNPYFAAY